MFYNTFSKCIADNCLNIDNIVTIDVNMDKYVFHKNMNKLSIYDTIHDYVTYLLEYIDDNIELGNVKDINGINVVITFKDFSNVYMYINDDKVVTIYNN